DLKRILAIVGDYDRVAMAGQRPLRDRAHHRLVLHYQHGAAAPQLAFLRLRRLGGRPGFLAVHGQIDDEAGPFADLRVRENEPAGLFDYTVDGRKSEAGSLADLLGRE